MVFVRSDRIYKNVTCYYGKTPNKNWKYFSWHWNFSEKNLLIPDVSLPSLINQSWCWHLLTIKRIRTLLCCFQPKDDISKENKRNRIKNSSHYYYRWNQIKKRENRKRKHPTGQIE